MENGQFRGLVRELCARVAGEIVPGASLARFTSLRVGGRADLLICPASLPDLLEAVRFLHRRKVPYLLLGRGSNLLVREGGVDGVVLRVGRGCRELRVQGNRLLAGAGTPLAQLAWVAARHGLAGLEFAVGIPGSVGGAVAMNAGAHGGCVADVLEAAHLVGPGGEVNRVPAAELDLGYRTSRVLREKQAVVAAEFRLVPGEPGAIRRRMLANLEARNATQPLAWPSAGSVFRNPPGAYAARLIEAAGLKGFTVGGAQVSEIHANFIVNRGGATAGDVLAVIEAVRARVREQHGVELELEIQVVGRP